MKSYWRVSRIAFMLLAVGTVLINGNATMASVWLACSLMCHATRSILDAIENRE